MSATVDERVVRMKFDNKQFESGVAESMSTIDKLKSKLNFNGAAKGLDNITKAASKVDLSGLEKSASAIEVKFSVMSMAAMAAIQNIVSSAMSAGKQIVKSLTIDQLTAGFDKYTQKTESVQTIMNATGKSINEVSAALDKLQWFSDETSYSFTDMVNNVGKFTSAGVDLDIAVSAMTGIANAAAFAGSNSEQASHAMEGFSKALGRGYVMLNDWTQIKTARMETVAFKNVLLESAVAMGSLVQTQNGYVTAAKGTAVSAGDFTSALREGWLTTEVLLDALGKFSAYSDRIYGVADAFDTCAEAMAATSEEGAELGAKAFKAAQQARTFTDAINATKDAVSSGWMRSFEIIFGDFEESVKLWTGLTNTLWDVFASGAEDRNERLTEGLMSGWKQLSKAGISDMERLQESIIETMGAADFDKMLEEGGFEDFEDALKGGFLTSDLLGKSIDNVVNKIKTLSDEELTNSGFTKKTAEEYLTLKAQMDAGLISIEDFTEKIGRMSGRENLIESVANAFKGLMSIVTPIKDAFQELFPPMTGEKIYELTKKIKEFTEQLKLSDEAAYTLKVIMKALLLPFKMVFQLLKFGIQIVGLTAIAIWKLIDALLAIPAGGSVAEKALRRVLGDDRYERLATALSTIVTRLGNAFSWLGAQIKGLFSKDNAEGTSKIGKALQQLYNILAPIGGWIIDRIIDGLEFLANYDYSKIIDWANKGLQFIIDKFQKFKEFVSPATEAIKSFFAQMKGRSFADGLSLIGEKIKNIYNIVVNFVKGLNLGKALDSVKEKASGFSGVLSVLLNGFVSLISYLTPARVLVLAFGGALIGVMLSIRKLTNSASGVLNGFSGILAAFQERIKPNKISQIAIAIGVLAAALIALSFIAPENLKQATTSLAIVVGLLAGMVLVMGLINKFLLQVKVGDGKTNDISNGFKEISKSLLMMGVAVLALATSLKMLDGVNLPGMIGNLTILAVAMGGLAGVGILMSRKAPELAKGASFFLAFSAAIMIIVSAFKKLAKIDMAGTEKNVVMLAGIVAMMVALSIASKNVKFGNAAGIALLCIDLLLLIKVLKKLQKEVNLELIINNLFSFTALMGAITVMALATKLAGEHALKAAAALLIITLAISRLISVIKSIAKIDQSDIEKGIVAVGAIMGLLTGVIAATKLAGENSAKSSAALGAVSASVLILSLAVKYLGGLEITKIIKGISAVSALISLFAIVLVAGKEAKGAASAILSISVAVALLTGAIMVLNLMPFVDALAAAASLAPLIIAIGVALSCLKAVNVKDVLPALVLMLSAIVILSIIMHKLSKVDPISALSTMGGLSVLLITMAGVMLLIGKYFKAEMAGKVIGGVGVLSACIAILGVLLGLIGGLMSLPHVKTWLSNGAEFITMLKSLLPVIAIMTALSLAFSVLGIYVVGLAAIIGAAVLDTVILLIGALIVGIGYIMSLPEVGTYIANGQTFLKMLESLSPVIMTLYAVSLAFTILGALGAGSIAGAAAFDIVILVISALVTGIGWLMSLGEVRAFATIGAEFLTLLGSLSSVIFDLGIVVGLLGYITPFAIAAIVGAAAFGIVIMELAEIISLLGGLSSVDGFQDLIANGSLVFEQIGGVIGGFFGSVVGKFIENSTDSLPQVSANLVDFVKNIKEAFKSAGEIGETEINAMNSLMELILLIAANDIVTSLASWFTGDISLTDFADELTEFIDPFSSFIDGLNGISFDGEKLSSFSDAVASIGDLLSVVQRHGGILQGIIGDKSLSKFAKELEDFAPKFKNYVGTMSRIKDFTIVETSAAAAESLATLASHLQPQFGTFQALAGSKNLSMFGLELKTFGPFFKSYADAVAGIKSFTIVKNSAAAAQSMADMAAHLQPQFGTFQALAGSKNLSMFGLELKTFGPFFKSYVAAVARIKSFEAVEASAAAAQSMADMAAHLQPQFGIWQALAGSKNLSMFGLELKTFGPAFADYANSVSGIADMGVITDSAAAAESLATLAQGLSGNTNQSNFSVIGAIANLFKDDGPGDLGVFGTQLKKLGKGLFDYYDSIKEVSFIKVGQATTAMQNLVDLNDGIERFNSTNLSNFTSALSELGKASLDSFADTINANAPEYQRLGSEIVSNTEQGIDSKKESLKTGIRTLGQNVVNTAKSSFGVLSYNGKFYQMGVDAMKGFVLGLNSQREKVKENIESIATDTINVAEKTLAINSPSKKFMDIGKYTVEGLANGIKKNSNLVEGETFKMGENILSSIQECLGIHSPSTVMRDEVGRYIVQGIAAGITSDMSAEDAMAKLAQNLVSAFKTELDKHSLDATTADLEYQLWQGLNPNASETAAQERLIDNLTKKLTSQAEKVKLANAEYQTTVQLMGESAEEAQEAYNKYLQEQITMTELASQLAEARGTVMVDQKDAYRNYVDYIIEYKDALLEAGFTIEEIEAGAKARTGYDPDKHRDAVLGVSDQVNEVQSIISEFLSGDVEAMIVDSVGSAITSSSASVSASGITLGESMIEGIMEGFDAEALQKEIQKAIEEAMDANTLSGLMEGMENPFADTWIGKLESGLGYVESGFMNLFFGEEGLLTRGGSWIMEKFYKGAEDAAEIHSPSKRSYRLAEYIMQGLFNGIEDNNEKAESTGEEMMDGLFTAAEDLANSPFYAVGGTMGAHITNGMIYSIAERKQEVANIFNDIFMEGIKAAYDLVQNSEYSHPVITPVLDLSQVQSQMSGLGAIFSSGVSSSAKRASAVSTAEVNKALYGTTSGPSGNSLNPDNGDISGGTTYNFTQNNYSPKAISSAEVYRNTNNLFSRLKGGPQE